MPSLWHSLSVFRGVWLFSQILSASTACRKRPRVLLLSGELLVLVLLSCSAALGSAVRSAGGHRCSAALGSAVRSADGLRVVLRNLVQGLGKLSYSLRLTWLLSEFGLKVVLLLQVSVGPCFFGSWCHGRYESCRTFRVLSLSLPHRFRVCPDDGVVVWRMQNCQLWLGCAQHPPTYRSILCYHAFFKDVFLHDAEVNHNRCQVMISGSQYGFSVP